MTEEQIERHVEHRVDSLDHLYIEGEISEVEYQARYRAISKWADDQSKRAKA